MECAINWCDTSFHTLWWNVWIYTLLLESGMPEWPWFFRCSHVHWCKNSHSKSRLLKGTPRAGFYHEGKFLTLSLYPLNKHHLEQGFCQAGFILHTLGRLGIMGMADNYTFSLTGVDLKSQTVSLLLESGSLLKPSLNSPWVQWGTDIDIFSPMVIEMKVLGFSK